MIKKKGDKKVEGTIKVGKKEYICELLPKELLIHRYFADECEQLQQLEMESNGKGVSMDGASKFTCVGRVAGRCGTPLAATSASWD